MKIVWLMAAVFVYSIQEIRSDSETTDDAVKFIAEYFLNQENSKSGPQALSNDPSNKEQQRNGEQDQLLLSLKSLPIDDEGEEEGEDAEEGPSLDVKKMIFEVDQTLEEINKIIKSSA